MLSAIWPALPVADSGYRSATRTGADPSVVRDISA